MAGIDIISDTTGQAIVESIKNLGTKLSAGKIVYGIHIDGADSNPSTRCRYLADAVGMTPAKMNYNAGVFDYGSWSDVFFMPRPCMLKTNGEVDYYLSENDYSKKADGSASDIANESYDGNAMMEWGNGNDLIWWKFEADKGNNTSGSFYVANYQADNKFKNLNHINIKGEVKSHFYTPIYNGSLDSGNKLRSLSGKKIMRNKNAAEEMSYARANGTGYEIEQYVDRLLISFLLVLISKTTDTQVAFGKGLANMTYAEESMIDSGTMNKKGLFSGEATGTAGVKVFGMENYWGNQHRRTVGLILDEGVYKVKLSPSTKDGSTANDYNYDGSGYIDVDVPIIDGDKEGYIENMAFSEYGAFPLTSNGSSTTYYCDWVNFKLQKVSVASFGGSVNMGVNAGAFYTALHSEAGAMLWNRGAALSYK